tara:strand:+ start:818 stop:1390 length:573 start_codon:yes stop_codon:yes gene_type:complete
LLKIKMLPKIIIVNGLPASGKTTLANKISKELKIPAIHKDQIKEDLFDSLNLKPSRKLSQELGLKAFKVMFERLDQSLSQNQSLILEANFKPEFDNQKFKSILSKYPHLLFQINCIADPKILFERFKSRSLENRHPMHCDSQNSQEWQEFFDKTQFQALDLKSKTININTNNFKEIHIKKIFHLLGNNLT